MTPQHAELDPVAIAAANAPLDDEPFTDADREEFDRRMASARAGNVVSHAELMQKLGL